MTYDQVLPAVAAMLQARYLEAYRKRRAEIKMPLAKARSKKRMPIPGVLDIAEIEG